MRTVAKEYLPKAFDEMEINRLIDAIRLFLQKNTEMQQFFKERVTEEIAHDYKSYVAGEMWLDLITDRLKKSYYRSQNHLWYDIDQIVAASLMYNGEDDELTDKAETFSKKLKKELKQYVNTLQANIRRNKMNFNHKSERDGLGFQQNGKHTPQNPNYSSSMIVMSQGSRQPGQGKQDECMENMEESKEYDI